MILASDALLGTDLAHAQGVALHLSGGRIARVETGAPAVTGARRLVMPALANAHDHARPLSLTSFGAAFMPLETWLPRSALATPPDPYLAAAAPLARAARSGCAAVMVHYTRPSGTMPLLDEAAAVARAANDIGVRIAFALAVRDQNPLVYGPSDEVLDGLPTEVRREIEATFIRPGMAPNEYIALTEAIASAIESPTVRVQFGPAGVQWCSRPLLEAVAERSEATGRRVHMHLLETKYQAEWARRAFPQGIVPYLKEIGLLSPRLTLAHCIYTSAADRELIAEAGATIVTNFGSNMGIRSGLAPVREARATGCRVCVGMDGIAFDEDDDMLREIRLVQAINGPWGLDDPEDRRDFLLSAVAEGRRSLGAPGSGILAEGEAADLLILDLDTLDRDAILPVEPLDLVFARGTAAHVRGLYVAGREVVAEGRVLGIDLDAVEGELRARFRELTAASALRRVLPRYESALRSWYLDRAGCC